MPRIVAIVSLFILSLTAMQTSAWARSYQPYSHAVQMELRREAFWRHHGSAREAYSKFQLAPDVMARKAAYWNDQQRGRAYSQ